MNNSSSNISEASWLSQQWQAYRNSLPLYGTHVDICHLQEGFASRFLALLVAGEPFQLAVNPGFTHSEQLKNAFFDAQLHAKAKSGQALGLGFPYFLGKDTEGKAIAAPLLIWQLDIEAAAKLNGGWTILRKPLHRVVPNYFLLSYWQQTYGFDALPLFEALEKKNPIRAKDLLQLYTELSDELGLAAEEAEEAELEIENAPSIKDFEATDQKGIIRWMATFGLFPPLNASFASSAAEAEPPSKKLAHPYSPIVLSPEQATAYEIFSKHSALWIGGASGSGKSWLGLHTAINALLNGQHCLVVSKSAGALRQYQEQLIQHGLGRLAFLLRDNIQDKQLFLNLIKAAILAKAPETNYEQKDYQFHTDKLERLKAKLDNAYRSTRKLVFRGHNWTNTVGLYLQSIQKEGRELLATQVNAADYDFTNEEFDQLREAITSCFELFQRTHTQRSSLNNLNPGIFLRMEKEEAAGFIEEKLEQLIEKGKRLQHWYINRIDTYSNLLANHYENYFEQLSALIIQLEDHIADQYARYGTSFGESSSRGLNIRKFFSSEASTKANAQAKIFEQFEKIKQQFNKSAYFDFDFLPDRELRSVSVVQQQLDAFQKSLQEWRMRQREIVQDEVGRLSLKTAHPKLNFDQQLEDLENSLNGFLEQINESGLYHLPFHNKTLVIPKQQRLLENVQEHLEETQNALPDFDNFYDWQSNWLELDGKARRLINVFVKVQPDNWLAALESWFFDNLLTKHYEAILPADIEDIKALGKSFEALKHLYLPYLLEFWHQRKEKAFKKFRRQHKKAYQAILDDKILSHQAFARFFKKGSSAIHEAMPILLTSPELLAHTLSKAGRVYDVIIVEEAQLLNEQETQFLNAISSRTMFLGYDNPQAPPPAKVYLEAIDAPRCQLDTIWAEYPSDLISAIQKFQHEQKNDLFAGRIYLEQVDGRYDEQLQNNEEEALRAISLLNEIKRTPQRTYPSVGIVGFTKGQRFLISSYLLDIKQRRSNGVETIQQLERNGMMVLSIDELEGQHFDYLIISGTYGPIGLAGTMAEEFHELSGENGVNALSTLMSRAHKGVFFLNSIPRVVLEDCLDQQSWNGAYLYAMYVEYLNAIQHENAPQINTILETLSERKPATEVVYPVPTVFIEQVQSYLAPYLGKGQARIHQYPELDEAPIQIPLSRQAGRSSWIDMDVFLGQTPYTDHRWEYAHILALEKNDDWPFYCHSANWWRNPNQEARKLASFIIKAEKEGYMDEEE
jgi:HPt (histidine-containing phosphotransfer) domain-containing protein